MGCTVLAVIVGKTVERVSPVTGQFPCGQTVFWYLWAVSVEVLLSGMLAMLWGSYLGGKVGRPFLFEE